MFVIQSVVPRDKIIVTRRDVDNLVGGDALAVDHREQICRHDSQQRDDDQLRPVLSDEALAIP